eukprot:1339491-Amphidinium_carterae.1
MPQNGENNKNTVLFFFPNFGGDGTLHGHAWQSCYCVVLCWDSLVTACMMSMRKKLRNALGLCHISTISLNKERVFVPPSKRKAIGTVLHIT